MQTRRTTFHRLLALLATAAIAVGVQGNAEAATATLKFADAPSSELSLGPGAQEVGGAGGERHRW
jgi:hypothetical protein